VRVTCVGSAIFLRAMLSERQGEFGAMRALGANLGHLRRFLFSEAFTIGGLSLVIGAGVGVLLARMLVPLLALSGFVLAGMILSSWVSARRLATLKVVEALRELQQSIEESG